MKKIVFTLALLLMSLSAALAQIVGHDDEEGGIHAEVRQRQRDVGLAAAVAGLKAGCHTDLLVVRRGQAQHDLTTGDELLAIGFAAKDRIEMFHKAPPDDIAEIRNY